MTCDNVVSPQLEPIGDLPPPEAFFVKFSNKHLKVTSKIFQAVQTNQNELKLFV
jgi:hypothetical protein